MMQYYIILDFKNQIAETKLKFITSNLDFILKKQYFVVGRVLLNSKTLYFSVFGTKILHFLEKVPVFSSIWTKS